jgi:ribosomal protein S18 acetylase RimI-like enzyme
VRPANDDDLSNVALIAAEGWRNAYRGLISEEAIEDMLGRWYSAEALSRRLSRGGLEVAEVNNRVIGFLQHGAVSDTIYEVFAIYVRPAFLGHGAGWAMWQRALDGAAREGRSAAIELWVLQGNRLGVDWYNRQNGVVVGERQVEMPDGPHTELRYRFNVGDGSSDARRIER